LPQTSVCYNNYQSQQPDVQYPIVQMLQTSGGQPVRQQSELVILQQNIMATHDDELNSKEVASEVSEKSEDYDSKSEISDETHINAITFEDLEQDERESIERAIEKYKLACLKTFITLLRREMSSKFVISRSQMSLLIWRKI